MQTSGTRRCVNHGPSPLKWHPGGGRTDVSGSACSYVLLSVGCTSWLVPRPSCHLVNAEAGEVCVFQGSDIKSLSSKSTLCKPFCFLGFKGFACVFKWLPWIPFESLYFWHWKLKIQITFEFGSLQHHVTRGIRPSFLRLQEENLTEETAFIPHSVCPVLWKLPSGFFKKMYQKTYIRGHTLPFSNFKHMMPG